MIRAITAVTLAFLLVFAGCSAPAGSGNNTIETTAGQPTTTSETPTKTPTSPPSSGTTVASTESPSPTPTATAAATPRETATATDTPSATSTSTPTPTPTPTPTATPTSTPSNSSNTDSGSGDLKIRIKYSGSWTGAVGAAGSIRSVDGSGTTTIDIKDGATIISANAQKGDGGSGKLVIQLLKDGEVVKQSSTSAQYGIASITASAPFDSTGGNGQSQSGTNSANYKVKIEYSGSWSGNVGTVGSTRSIDGTGTKVVDIDEDGSTSVVTAVIQKQEANSEKLTVTILKNENVVKQKSTTTEYGVVTVSVSA
jgi:hypothetical protein